MPAMIEYCFGKKGGLTTALVPTAIGVDLTGPPATETRAIAVPGKCHLDSLRMLFEVTAGAPTAVTWFLSEDSLGKFPVSDQRTDPLAASANVAFKSTILALRLAYKRTSMAVGGTLFIQWKLDAGTATSSAFLYVRTD